MSFRNGVYVYKGCLPRNTWKSVDLKYKNIEPIYRFDLKAIKYSKKH